VIEITKIIPGEMPALARWLEAEVKPQLTGDVSNYSKGRPRCWLRIEPGLISKIKDQPGVHTPNEYWEFLEWITGWRFDYCLVTYSGDETPVGITPHRDSGFADYEAYGLNITSTSEFRYWNARNSFGFSHPVRELTAYDPPTHVVEQTPGMVTRFNCKNIHAAIPQPKRWAMNFWRKKKR